MRKTNWELYKRQQIRTYSKRRQQYIILFVIIAFILLYLLCKLI